VKMRMGAVFGLLVTAAALGGCAAGAPRGSVQPQGTLAEAAQIPLSDANLVKVTIPDALLRAVADPYDPRGMGECRAIATEISRLDDALGPDADAWSGPDTRSDVARTADTAQNAAMTVVREGVRSAIPFRGWLRQISGAARAEREVEQAIIAGATRRGYLKGVGMRLNCPPPASPSWFTPVAAAAGQGPATR